VPAKNEYRTPTMGSNLQEKTLLIIRFVPSIASYSEKSNQNFHDDMTLLFSCLYTVILPQIYIFANGELIVIF
jgi:hypothetical protein